jgi:hypothetical protein
MKPGLARTAIPVQLASDREAGIQAIDVSATQIRRWVESGATCRV